MEQTETKDKPTLSQEAIVRAATNDPALSELEVDLDGQKFKIVDLPYDEYLEFFAYLSPLLEAVGESFMSGNVSGLNASLLLKYCGKTLPELARLSLKQTVPDITVEEIKLLGKNPVKLACIVLAQMRRNQMVRDIADFFVQIRPLLVEAKGARLTTGETR